MRLKFLLLVALLSSPAVVLAGTAEAGFLRVGKIAMDGNRWGGRAFTIPFENTGDDTARVSVTLTTSYPKHYLSGNEKMTCDTSYTIPPHYTGDVRMEFILDGSFGQARMEIMIRWRHDGDSENAGSDSLGQVFTNNFAGRQAAQGFDSYRYGIGPAHAAMKDRQLCFDYPRLLLYLTARGNSVEDVDTIMRPDPRYTWAIAEHFYNDGVFPGRPETTAPAVLALDETEAFAIRDQVIAFNDEFKAWYAKKGLSEITGFCGEAGIDSTVLAVPAFRMLFLYSLLSDGWSEGRAFQPRFVNGSDDDFALNHVHWIIQGGEFFQPRVCLGAYLDDTANILNCGAFEPDPSLVCSKSAMEAMHMRCARAHKNPAIMMPAVTGEQLSRALRAATGNKCVKAMTKQLNESMAKSLGGLAFYNESLEPCLADYFIRMALGDCFKGDHPFDLEKCFAVRY